MDSKIGGDSGGLSGVRQGGGPTFLAHKLPLGNAIFRSSAARCALGVPRGLLGRPAKAKRELRGGPFPQQEPWNERLNEEKMAVGGLAAILAFFGVDPKKVPLVLATASAICPTT